MARFVYRLRTAPEIPPSPILGSHDLLIVTVAECSGKGALSLSRER